MRECENAGMREYKSRQSGNKESRQSDDFDVEDGRRVFLIFGPSTDVNFKPCKKTKCKYHRANEMYHCSYLLVTGHSRLKRMAEAGMKYTRDCPCYEKGERVKISAKERSRMLESNELQRYWERNG